MFGLPGIIVALTNVLMGWLTEPRMSRVSRTLLREIATRDRAPTERANQLPQRPRTFIGNTISLNDAKEDRRVARLDYDPATSCWTILIRSVEVGGIEIYVHGTSGGPDLERFLMVEPVLGALETLAFRAQQDLNMVFRNKTAPLGGWPLNNPEASRFREGFERGLNTDDEWELLTVYFGFVGNEPADEFSLHFGWGIWDWSTPYYTQYRLNREILEESVLIGWNREDWIERSDL